jgi:hypothetical protein
VNAKNGGGRHESYIACFGRFCAAQDIASEIRSFSWLEGRMRLLCGFVCVMELCP